MHSALYTGTLRHHRLTPVAHAFVYRMTWAYLDLAELEQVFRGRWLWSTRRPAFAWLRRADYLGDARVPLDVAVREEVARRLQWRPSGPIRLLTQLRTFGTCFNPVSFYYCYDTSGTRVDAVVAEITNTPWNERHAYVLDARNLPARSMSFRFQKDFHVSPFMPMDVDYDWRFGVPGADLRVDMANSRKGKRVFDATLDLQRREITGGSLALALARHPLGGARVLFAIYWQALRLWVKRAPFYRHPA